MGLKLIFPRIEVSVCASDMSAGRGHVFMVKTLVHACHVYIYIYTPLNMQRHERKMMPNLVGTCLSLYSFQFWFTLGIILLLFFRGGVFFVSREHEKSRDLVVE